MKKSKRRLIKTADEIRRKVKGEGFVQEAAYDILLVIESDIEKAIENKSEESITEISTNFNFPPMKREDAQRAVYFCIIKELRESGYIPKIKFVGSKEGEQQVFIVVKWKTSLDETEEQAMDNYIKQHSVVDSTVKSKPVGSRRRR